MGAIDFKAEDAFRLVDGWWARYFSPPDDITVEQWADGRLILPREMTSEPGPMRLERTPYLRDIFADLADPGVEEIVLMFGTQLGKSTALLALMGYVIDHDPAPMMMVLPTLDVARKFSKQRIAPLIQSNQSLRDRVAEVRSRNSDNTALTKSFRGGMFVITGANAPSGLASMPAKVMLFDEVDDYPDDAGGQGDPIEIASARQDTFARRKRVKCSSPKKPKGQSTIENGFLAGTQGKFYVPCPYCGHFQTLRWEGIKWVKDPEPKPESAAYACESCEALIDEHFKTQMLERGEWRHYNPSAKIRSYQLSSIYSPLGWLNWSSLVNQWIKSCGAKDAGRLEPFRTFINTRLAETWEEKAESLAVNELQQSAKPFPLRTVPHDGLILVAFVDVQDDRFEIGVWAFGEGGDDMWTVDHIVVPDSPALVSGWEKVDAALKARYRHAAGGELMIEAAAIDTGGHFTHDVYSFVRTRASSRRIAATKGADRPGMPILGKANSVDVNWRGGVIKNGVKLWLVGTNAAKDLLYNKICAGRVHMSKELPREWFEQLSSEHRVQHRSARGMRYVWQKKSAGAPNEVLDCAVGAVWCAERLGLQRWPKKYWELVRSRIAPDLFKSDQPVVVSVDSAPAEEEGGTQKKQLALDKTKLDHGRRVRRAGFVNNW